MSEPQTPDWVRDAVFYQIFPDRFARSLTVPKPAHLDEWGAPPTPHGYQGGDLVGVVEQLDYLEDLGVNAIYFTPIFQSASNHRYHTHDYEKVDPMLGGNAALRRLHRRGPRAGRCGSCSTACSTTRAAGSSSSTTSSRTAPTRPISTGSRVNGFPLNAYDRDKAPGYKAWWGLPALPEVQHRHAGRPRVPLGDRPEVDRLRHRRLAARRRQRDRRRRVLAGVPPPGPRGESRGVHRRRGLDRGRRAGSQGDMWDAVMNYLFTRACIAFFIGDDGRRGRAAPDQPLPRRPVRRRDVPPKRSSGCSASITRSVTSVMLNLLDSHDMARFVTLARGDQSALRLATLFQMTYPGAPSIYYGDEIGMAGGHDPVNRGAFPWHKPDVLGHRPAPRLPAADRPAQGPPGAAARARSPSCTPRDDVFAYARQLGEETVVIALNAAQRARGGSTSRSRACCPTGRGLDEVWSDGVGRQVEAG